MPTCMYVYAHKHRSMVAPGLSYSITIAYSWLWTDYFGLGLNPFFFLMLAFGAPKLPWFSSLGIVNFCLSLGQFQLWSVTRSYPLRDKRCSRFTRPLGRAGR
ncbi:hypothetical protein BX600DRAFT_315778 [Xylariales sp. PMI_506]|nr:hypothetical protein BX600DRAFT_315778 [Xylariales sp. PMI_506]